MDLEHYLQGGKYSISEEKYSILRSKVTYAEAFANIIDKNEITVIAKERDATYSIPQKEILDVDHNWKIITFEMELPFELIGFLAKISNKLAKADISIFVISAFSTDHLLVKEEDIDRTIEVLQSLGMTEHE